MSRSTCTYYVHSTKNICPGGAGNVSLNLAKANIPVSLLTVAGNDYDSVNLFRILNEQNVDISMSIIKSEQNINKKTRYTSGNHILLRVDIENTVTLTHKIEEEILAKIKSNINLFDIIVLSDYNKGLLTKNLIKKLYGYPKNIILKYW